MMIFFFKNYLISQKNIITYGKSIKSNYYYKIDKLTEKDSRFYLFKKNEKKITKIRSPLLGEHNVQNLCAIMAVIKHLNIQISNKDVMNFKGIQRRMNTLGKIKKTILVDDYAHHPTEIHKLIEGL